MEDIMKIVKSLEYFCLLLKEVSKTIQNEAKEQKRWIFSMLLGTLGASLLGNMLAGKGVNGAGYGSTDFQFKGNNNDVYNNATYFNSFGVEHTPKEIYW